MRSRLLFVPFVILASTAQAQSRPNSLTMSCAAVGRLVEQQGTVLLGTGTFSYDRYVSSGNSCGPAERPDPAWVRSADSQQCFVGYRCRGTAPGGRGSRLPIRQDDPPSDLRTRAAREKPSHLYDPASYCLERSAGPLTQLAQLVPQGVDLPLNCLQGRAFRRDEEAAILAAGVAQESNLDGRNSVWGPGLDIVQRLAIGA
jgi:hypothetical protein